MYYIDVKRIMDESANDVAEVDPSPPTKTSTEIKMPKEIDINVAHGLCHLGEKLLRVTFNEFRVKLTVTMTPCDK